jgi:putative membrane protein
MTIRWLLATIHLLALGIGLGAIAARSRGLRAPVSESRLSGVFTADALWGVSALLWISTGLWRAFGGLEKGSAYYLSSTAFLIKMTILGLILVLEVWPMLTLIRWRAARAKGDQLSFEAAPALSRISAIQAVLVVAMVFAATAMARGIGS